MKQKIFLRANVLFTLMLIFFITSCKTLQVEKPRESYLPSKLNPVMSEIPLKVEVDMKKIESTVNKKLTGLIYEGNNINNQDLSLKVWKVQNFTFNVNNNVIEYRVPLKIWSRFAWKIEKFGLSMSDHYEANGSIALTYKTTINIDKNWNLVAKTSAVGYQWLQTPKLNVVGVNVPVTPIANLVLSQGDKLITDQIDQVLSQMVDLKKYVNMAWTEVQNPVQMSPENDLWVRITPKDIYVSPLTSVGPKLNVGMSLYSQIESFMGVKPDVNAIVPLPAFKYVQHAPQQFNINIAADATFDKITEVAKKQLVNQTFADGKKSITIEDLSVYGSEGKAIFVIDVKGSLKGRIYFTGDMVYNPDKLTIEIQHPEFDVKTKNALVKSANWLLHGLILNKISPYLTYSVSEELDDMKKEANSMISNYKVMDGVTLNGALNTINVTGLSLVPGAVRIGVNVKGNIGLKVDDLNF
ncbi:MAG: DUF4403 family protein [Paludibacter sp.]|nr:DUF4403 family protein [Paludibacter sp.]